MNITHDETTGNVQFVTFEIAKTDYSENVEKELKKYRKTAQIPGFRVGNAPMGMIKRNYEKPLIADEVNKIVSENLNKYFEENSISIMFEPMLLEENSIIDFEKSEDFVFAFEYAVQPELELDFAALPLLKSFKIKAAKDEIEDFMTQIRKRHGDYIYPETIEDDDYVSVKWGEEQNGFFFIKDLSDKGKEWFLGKKKDETVSVVFNEMFVSEESLKKFLKITDENIVENNAETVEVNISSIGRMNLAEMNEDFFKKAFPDGSITTVAAFKKHAAIKVKSGFSAKRKMKRFLLFSTKCLFRKRV